MEPTATALADAARPPVEPASSDGMHVASFRSPPIPGAPWQRAIDGERDMSESKKTGRGTGGRGFASMSETRRREVAREGGRSAHARGHAHTFDSEEARQAGRRGGSAVSADRAHMSAIGRIGGARSRIKRPRPDLSNHEDN
jgi:general stress protein YciG